MVADHINTNRVSIGLMLTLHAGLTFRPVSRKQNRTYLSLHRSHEIRALLPLRRYLPPTVSEDVVKHS